jgi:hypothetical protein
MSLGTPLTNWTKYCSLAPIIKRREGFFAKTSKAGCAGNFSSCHGPGY